MSTSQLGLGIHADRQSGYSHCGIAGEETRLAGRWIVLVDAAVDGTSAERRSSRAVLEDFRRNGFGARQAAARFGVGVSPAIRRIARAGSAKRRHGLNARIQHVRYAAYENRAAEDHWAFAIKEHELILEHLKARATELLSAVMRRHVKDNWAARSRA